MYAIITMISVYGIMSFHTYAVNKVIAKYEIPTYEHQGLNKYIKLIKDTYGITLHINEDPMKFYDLKPVDMEFETNISEKTAFRAAVEIYYVLEKYNEKAFEYIPEDIFLVSNYSKDGSYDYAGEYIQYQQRKFIVLTDKDTYQAGDLTYNLDHEIFHSYTVGQFPVSHVMNVPLKFWYDQKQTGETCDMVDDYACTHTFEYLSEIWTRSFWLDNLDTYQLVRDYFYEELLTTEYLESINWYSDQL